MKREDLKQLVTEFSNHFIEIEGEDSYQKLMEGISLDDLVDVMQDQFRDVYEYEVKIQISEEQEFSTGRYIKDSPGILLQQNILNSTKGILQVTNTKEVWLFDDMSFFVIKSVLSTKENDGSSIQVIVREIDHQENDLNKLEIDYSDWMDILVSLVLNQRLDQSTL